MLRFSLFFAFLALGIAMIRVTREGTYYAVMVCHIFIKCGFNGRNEPLGLGRCSSSLRWNYKSRKVWLHWY